MKYFAFSPDTGFELYETAEKAKAAAQESIDQYAADAVDGWSEEVESVYWGEIKQESVMMNQRPSEPGSDVDFICDYGLTDIES